MNYITTYLLEAESKFLAKGDQEGADICSELTLEYMDRPEYHEEQDDLEMTFALTLHEAGARTLKAIEAIRSFIVSYHAEPEHA